MNMTIDFTNLFKKSFHFETKETIVQFFKQMKEEVCTDLKEKNSALLTLIPNQPTCERVVVQIVSSTFQPTVTGFHYEGSFAIHGVHTNKLYDTVTVSCDDVDFLLRVSSINDYFLSIFSLRYNGFFMKKEDIEHYALSTNIQVHNNRIISLRPVDFLPALALETQVDKVGRLAKELSMLVGKKPFEVSYIFGSIEQTVLYVYDPLEHYSYLSSLIDRTRTHTVRIRFIDNEIIEWFYYAKGLKNAKIRKCS